MKELWETQSDLRFFQCLKDAGVHKWEGYELALEAYRARENKEYENMYDGLGN